MAAALASKRRDNSISEGEYEGAMRDFIRDAQQQYQVVITGQEVIDLAVELTRRQMLRGYDAVELLHNWLTGLDSTIFSYGQNLRIMECSGLRKPLRAGQKCLKRVVFGIVLDPSAIVQQL